MIIDSTHSIMKKVSTSVIFTCCIAGFGVNLAEGSEARWSGLSEVAFSSVYIFRGTEAAGPIIQPTVLATYADTVDSLTFGLSGAYGLKRDSILAPGSKYSETNFRGFYTHQWASASMSLGGTIYRINGLSDFDTGKSFKYYGESVASVAFKIKFDPTISFWREYGRLQTNYVEISASHRFRLSKEFDLTIRPHLGVIERGFNYFGAETSLSYDIGNRFYALATVGAQRNNFGLVRRDRAFFSTSLGRRW